MPIPAVPNAGTADTNPLITVGQYQAVTGDTGTAADVVTENLADALDLFQRCTYRTLLYGQYTERLFLYRNAMVYPTATPFDISKTVNSPLQVGDPTVDVGIFQGNGIWVGWFIPLPSLPVWTGVVPPQTDVSYWGGYTGPDGAGPYLPASMKRAVCKICWYLNNPQQLPSTVGSAKSVNLGGVSISGELGSMIEGDRQLWCQIKRWRHPQARHFDGQATTLSL